MQMVYYFIVTHFKFKYPTLMSKKSWQSFQNLHLYKKLRCWKTKSKPLIHSKCTLSQILAWMYSINHRYTNIVEDFDSSITIIPKEFFILDYVKRYNIWLREIERDRERERERERAIDAKLKLLPDSILFREVNLLKLASLM